MSKERLEEIKNSHLRGIHSLFGTPWVSIPKENFDWLIEQAERVRELEGELIEQKECFEELQNNHTRVCNQNKRYREALDKQFKEFWEACVKVVGEDTAYSIVAEMPKEESK